MRVLHLLKTSIGTRWALHQMRELRKLDVEVHVALPPGGPLIAACEAAGIVVHQAQFDFPVRRPWKFPPIAGDIRALVGQVQPDIIHSHFVGPWFRNLGGNQIGWRCRPRRFSTAGSHSPQV